MNRRQRKKHRIGEFTQWAFEISGTFRDGVDVDQFIDDLISVGHPDALMVGGGTYGETPEDAVPGFHFCVHHLRRSTSPDDEARYTAWLSVRQDVLSSEVGRRFDVNR